MESDSSPPANFGVKWIAWQLWQHAYDVLGIAQIVFGTIAASSGGLPHPWGSVAVCVSGILTNILARFKK